MGGAVLVDVLELDSRGRITIPRKIRKRLGVGEGSRLYIFYDEERKLLIISPKPELEEHQHGGGSA